MKRDGSMISHRNDYLFSDELLPVQRHQMMEELLQFERELAGCLYLQKDKERDL